jgi:hypothetical protein
MLSNETWPAAVDVDDIDKSSSYIDALSGESGLRDEGDVGTLQINKNDDKN